MGNNNTYSGIYIRVEIIAKLSHPVLLESLRGILDRGQTRCITIVIVSRLSRNWRSFEHLKAVNVSAEFLFFFFFFLSSFDTESRDLPGKTCQERQKQGPCSRGSLVKKFLFPSLLFIIICEINPNPIIICEM